jgi:hypothetical protein
MQEDFLVGLPVGGPGLMEGGDLVNWRVLAAPVDTIPSPFLPFVQPPIWIGGFCICARNILWRRIVVVVHFVTLIANQRNIFCVVPRVEHGRIDGDWYGWYDSRRRSTTIWGSVWRSVWRSVPEAFVGLLAYDAKAGGGVECLARKGGA